MCIMPFRRTMDKPRLIHNAMENRTNDEMLQHYQVEVELADRLRRAHRTRDVSYMRQSTMSCLSVYPAIPS